MTDRYKKLVSNTGIIWLGTFGSKLLVFLLMPLYTAYLSTEEYGTAELITATANLLIPLACVGVTNAVFRFCVDRESDKQAVFSSSVALLLCGFGVFVALSPLLLLSNHFSAYLGLIVAYVVFADVQAICAQYVRAVDKTRLFAIQGIFNTGITILLNLLFLIICKMGVTGYVLSVIVGNILTTVFLVIAAKLWRVFSWKRIQKGLMLEMLRFCAPLIPTTVCWLITDLSDRYMVTYFCGSDVNGIYSAAYKIPTVINLLSTVFLTAWQFSAISESSDENGIQKFYTNVYSGFTALIFGGASVLILLSGVLTKLLLNSAYHDAWKYMPTLICAATIEAMVSFLATVYLVRKKSVHSLISALLGSVVNVVLNLLWIPKHGALGAAVATLTAYGAVFVFRMIDTPRMIRFKIDLIRLVVSIVSLLGLSAIMTVEQIPHRFLWASLVAGMITVLNFPALWKSVRVLFAKGKDEA